MHSRGVLAYIDAVGMHGFPGSPEFPWKGWDREIGDVREHLGRLGCNAEFWITATGFSTWRGDEQAQARAFIEAVDAPVERVYWREVQDSGIFVGRFVPRR